MVKPEAIYGGWWAYIIPAAIAIVAAVALIVLTWRERRDRERRRTDWRYNWERQRKERGSP